MRDFWQCLAIYNTETHVLLSDSLLFITSPFPSFAWQPLEHLRIYMLRGVMRIVVSDHEERDDI